MFIRVSTLFGMLIVTAFVSAHPFKCIPGTRSGPCNNCICTESGEIACTNVACPPRGGDPFKCIPGTRSGPCNNCICTEDGEIACTNVACPPPGGDP
ncbi:hypothetical protein C8J57DRAFT_433514 [Mycena rebaudengoi]|nr:hypothetical protein C8J57DRAFT_433514 [Mycena rebaudengoi]